MKTLNSISVIILALLMSGMLILFDNIEFAYAVTQTQYTNQGAGVQRHAMNIVRLGDILYVSGDSTGDRISTFEVNTDGTLTAITQITCADCQELWIAGSGTGARVYTRTNNPAPTIHEISSDGLFIARSLATSCNQNTQQFPTTANANIIICPDGTNDQLDIVNRNVNPMNKTDGGDINSGVFACDDPRSAILSSADDVVFVGCQGVQDRIVVLDNIDLTVAQAPIEGIGVTDLTPHEMSYARIDATHRHLLVCDGAQNLFLVIWNGTDLLQQADINTGECITSQNANTIWYNSALKAFFVVTDSGTVLNIDAYDGEILDTITLSIGAGIGASPGISTFENSETWVTYSINTGTFQFAKFTWGGLHIGAEGIGNGGTFQEEDDQSTGGIDCTLPANANILICRLGGDNNFGGIGNATGTGLLNLGCNIIFVDCTNTNPQTNGLGLLAFIASLFVIIGMFYYTIGKEAFHMPIFIWIVIVIALSAFFTIAGWIDPVFLVLTIVALVALAVPKIMNIVRGSGSTLGEGSSA